MYKKDLKKKRILRVRSKLRKTDNLRLSLFRSHKHIYAQLINDEKSETITSASSYDKTITTKNTSPKEIAFKVGEIIGEKIKEKKINKKILLDRGRYLYHGRVKELAMGVRSKGIKF